MPPVPQSMLLDPTARLSFTRLSEANLDAFHRLALDAHIRRYLLDGQEVDRDWCLQQRHASDELFERSSLGMWLVDLRESDAAGPIGFCGFIRMPEIVPDPQLLYALLGEHTGRGYATEIAQALVTHARKHASLTELITGVDEPNTASMRVLEKLGFEIAGSVPGMFGRIVLYRLKLSDD